MNKPAGLRFLNVVVIPPVIKKELDELAYYIFITSIGCSRYLEKNRQAGLFARPAE
jgi:hypothetical protein